jgi:hypothetical protein
MSKTATIVIEDEVNIHIKNIDLPVKKALVNCVKYFLPDAKYSWKFKQGYWDGTTSFCTLGGRSYLNILDKLLVVLQQHDFDFEFDDQRNTHDFDFEKIDEDYLSGITWPSDHRFAGQPIALRDYQVEAVNTCLDNLQGVNVLATGAGKTLITASLSKLIEPYGRSIVIVPNKNLVKQTEEDYRNIGLDVGVLFGDRKEYDCKHTICTWQSLNVLDKKSKDRFDDYELETFLKDITCVICDECFDGESRVLTTTGYVPIKNIMAGDKVINYCEKSKQFKVDTIVKKHKNLAKSVNEKMYELEFDNGNKIKVTGNHKFLTDTGWCRADELTVDHEIISYEP